MLYYLALYNNNTYIIVDYSNSMRNSKIIANIGRFVEEKGENYYVDKDGHVWSHKMIADLMASHKCLKYTLGFVEHYKKFLESK